jgi:hypothetical protein
VRRGQACTASGPKRAHLGPHVRGYRLNRLRGRVTGWATAYTPTAPQPFCQCARRRTHVRLRFSVYFYSNTRFSIVPAPSPCTPTTRPHTAHTHGIRKPHPSLQRAGQRQRHSQGWPQSWTFRPVCYPLPVCYQDLRESQTVPTSPKKSKVVYQLYFLL